MNFSCQKGEFDLFFDRLDRPVEESRPNRQPDRFPSLYQLALLQVTLTRYSQTVFWVAVFFLLCCLLDTTWQCVVVHFSLLSYSSCAAYALLELLSLVAWFSFQKRRLALICRGYTSIVSVCSLLIIEF